jgi:hypothetical protein
MQLNMAIIITSSGIFTKFSSFLESLTTEYTQDSIPLRDAERRLSMGDTEEVKARSGQANIQLVFSRKTTAKKVKFCIRIFKKHHAYLTKVWHSFCYYNLF